MSILSDIIFSLPVLRQHHSRQTGIYRILERTARSEVESNFHLKDFSEMLGPIGKISFPYHRMGSVDSIDLFGLDELIIFAFYWVNRNRYRNVLDIGANIGLHSTVLAKCGYQVTIFEPDPVHFSKLQEILKINGIQHIDARQAAVSNRAGAAEFVRVLGNTTSSHIAGCKQPYGEVEKFEVPVFDIRDIIRGFDLVKMDVEGHEDALIEALSASDWDHIDAMIEVGSSKAAESIFNHLSKMGVHSFSQKNGWEPVRDLGEMPASYKEGSLFISKKNCMPWNS